MIDHTSGRTAAPRGTAQAGRVLEQLSDLYTQCRAPGYEPETHVETFYSSRDFWAKFERWLQEAPGFYPGRDKAFVESVVQVDGARVVNIGTYYPWAEIEWGRRASEWVGLDNNPHVLARARDVLARYPHHRVTLLEADVTEPLELAGGFDFVLDLSTFDHLDPRRFGTILDNYKRLSGCLVMAYDATREPLAEFDFERCGFNARLHPTTMAALLEEVGYTVVTHEPYAHEEYRSYIMARL